MKMRKYRRTVSAFLILLMLFQLSSCGRDKTFSSVYNVGSLTLTLNFSSENADPEGKDFEQEKLLQISSDCRDVFERSLDYLDEGRKSSPLYEINSDVDAVLDCDGEIISVLKRAKELSELTSGAFQPFVGDGELQIGEGEIRKTDKSARADLSSLHEAYALEKAADSLRNASSAYGVLSLENIACVFGTKPKNEKFNISVEADGKNIGWFCIPSGCVASVDAYGKSGEGCGEFSRVAVYAADGLSAAAIAEAIWTKGVDYAEELHTAHASSFAAVAILSDGDIYITDGAEDSGLFVVNSEDEK